jgi:hypothetical protein
VALRKLLEPRGEDGIGVRPGATALEGAALAQAGLSSREVQELREKLGPSALPDFELDLSKMKSAEVVSAEMERAVPGVFE